MKLIKGIMSGLIASLGLSSMVYAGQGVSDTEIVIGSNQDMSGPFAAFGAPAMAASKQYFDKVNAAGGVHGRTIKLVVEDMSYQMPKAQQNLNKLVNSDKIFVMYQQMGTPFNLASFELLESKKIANVAPLSGSARMATPYNDYRYASTSDYASEIVAGVEYIHKETGASVVCAMYLPTDFGMDIMTGAKDGAAAVGIKYASETTHKPDEEDFVGALSKLKGEGCELIALALGLRQQITVLATAKKLGWMEAKFLGASASMHTAVAKVPGGLTEGYYVSAGWSDLIYRMENPKVAAWVAEYQGEFGEFPGTGALLGRAAAEQLVMALEAAGRDLTPESFQKAMESLDYYDELLGNQITFGPNDHVGSKDIIISQIIEGNWKELLRK
tara:strand:- start:31 stop:1188 length:1158 start_codon:yes stop_codon:yes gene_type:complete